MTRRLVEEHVQDLLRDCGAVVINGQTRWPDTAEPRPQAVICDHDAEGRATLEKYLVMATIPARKKIAEGIQAVAARLRRAGDGKPRIFYLRDSLVRRDPSLVELKRPCCAEEEFDSYVWQTKKTGVEKGLAKDAPAEEASHAMDAMRYLVAHFDLLGTPGDVYLAPREEPRRLGEPWGERRKSKWEEGNEWRECDERDCHVPAQVRRNLFGAGRW
jgi:phage terminase large subunit